MGTFKSAPFPRMRERGDFEYSESRQSAKILSFANCLDKGTISKNQTDRYSANIYPICKPMEINSVSARQALA